MENSDATCHFTSLGERGRTIIYTSAVLGVKRIGNKNAKNIFQLFNLTFFSPDLSASRYVVDISSLSQLCYFGLCK